MMELSALCMEGVGLPVPKERDSEPELLDVLSSSLVTRTGMLVAWLSVFFILKKSSQNRGLLSCLVMRRSYYDGSSSLDARPSESNKRERFAYSIVPQTKRNGG
mmetsp:Transcript_17573/g.28416  ORF Transcript_17573/g.28416 Transcript_17573/m.28416 type:complete len:104 (+) Transcript_17573:1209-1520(+)